MHGEHDPTETDGIPAKDVNAPLRPETPVLGARGAELGSWLPRLLGPGPRTPLTATVRLLRHAAKRAPSPVSAGADREDERKAECQHEDEHLKPATAMIRIDPENDLDPVMPGESDSK